MAIGLAPAAVAYAGGTPAPSVTGGSEYGAVLASARPVRPIARIFTVNPKVVVAPRLPRLRVRVDQPGSRSVRARLVFRPRGSGAVVRVDAGRIPTGKRVAVEWPAGSQLPPGRYLAQLIVRGRGNAVLARTASARGMTTVTVRAPAPPPAPHRAPAPGAPSRPGAGVFPVAGPHTYGDGFGAARTRPHAPGPGHRRGRGPAGRGAARRDGDARSTTSRRRRAGTSCCARPTGATCSSPTARRARSRVARGRRRRGGRAAVPRRPHRRRDRPAPALRDLGRRLAGQRREPPIDPLADLQAWDPTA